MNGFVVDPNLNRQQVIAGLEAQAAAAREEQKTVRPGTRRFSELINIQAYSTEAAQTLRSGSGELTFGERKQVVRAGAPDEKFSRIKVLAAKPGTPEAARARAGSSEIKSVQRRKEAAGFEGSSTEFVQQERAEAREAQRQASIQQRQEFLASGQSRQQPTITEQRSVQGRPNMLNVRSSRQPEQLFTPDNQSRLQVASFGEPAQGIQFTQSERRQRAVETEAAKIQAAEQKNFERSQNIRSLARRVTGGGDIPIDTERGGFGGFAEDVLTIQGGAFTAAPVAAFTTLRKVGLGTAAAITIPEARSSVRAEFTSPQSREAFVSTVTDPAVITTAGVGAFFVAGSQQQINTNQAFRGASQTTARVRTGTSRGVTTTTTRGQSTFRGGGRTTFTDVSRVNPRGTGTFTTTATSTRPTVLPPPLRPFSRFTSPISRTTTQAGTIRVSTTGAGSGALAGGAGSTGGAGVTVAPSSAGGAFSTTRTLTSGGRGTFTDVGVQSGARVSGVTQAGTRTTSVFSGRQTPTSINIRSTAPPSQLASNIRGEFSFIRTRAGSAFRGTRGQISPGFGGGFGAGGTGGTGGVSVPRPTPTTSIPTIIRPQTQAPAFTSNIAPQIASGLTRPTVLPPVGIRTVGSRAVPVPEEPFTETVLRQERPDLVPVFPQQITRPTQQATVRPLIVSTPTPQVLPGSRSRGGSGARPSPITDTFPITTPDEIVQPVTEPTPDIITEAPPQVTSPPVPTPATITGFTGRPGAAFTPPPFIPFGGLPPLSPRSRPSFSFGFPGFKIRTPRAFTPSLGALGFNIRGRRPSKRAERTGLTVRPLPFF